MQNTQPQHEADNHQTRRDLHQQVTDQIISQLEAGTIPWEQPWTGDGSKLLGIPKNTHTGNKYRGVNILLLWSAAVSKQYSSPEWATLKQWNAQKQFIRKGESGSMIVFYEMREKEVDGEIKKIPLLVHSKVFNRCQLAGYTPPDDPAETNSGDPVTKQYRVEEFVESTGAKIVHEGSSAHYTYSEDAIYLPEPGRFKATASSSATESYYATLAHELVHWSGAEHRLNRVKGRRFGDEQYANEELVAELGAAFLCSGLEISTPKREDHAAYIASWLEVLKENKKAIFKAASAASTAIDYLYSLQPAEPAWS